MAPRAESESDQVWFISVNDTEFGPVSMDQLRILKQKDLLLPDHWVRHTDHGDWTAARSIPNLFEQNKNEEAANPYELKNEPKNLEPYKHKSKNYFIRHWRGELSLPISYWVNGFLGNIIAVVVVVLLARNIDFKDEFKPEIALLVVTMIWTTIVIVGVWQVIGTWRSATNYALVN